MHLVSVNVSQAQPIENAKPSGKTGIFKMPAGGPVLVTRGGLAGDVVCDTANHGGPDQAVYVYAADDYAWWSAQLGRELAPGTFGESLTISAGLDGARVRIGDYLHVGASVVLQITAARIPCVTLARRMDDPGFVARFRAAERPGLYCRVLREGYVQAGDPVVREDYAGETITVLELFHDFFEPDRSEAGIRRFLAAPLAVRARAHKEKQSQELPAPRPGRL